MKFINVLDRKTFDTALHDISKSDVMVVDTETNGLRAHRNNYVISISVYLPDIDVGYNFPFRHGEGQVSPAYNEREYKSSTWQGDAKKLMYLDYWYTKYREQAKYNNLPEDWMTELKSVWNKPGTHVYHNATFDLHMLAAENFPTPANIIDTLINAHVILEDWRGTQFEAPYTYTKKDCVGNDNVYDTWATDSDGNLLIRKGYGNRKLKWQSVYLQHKGLIDNTYPAHEGELQLYQAATDLEDKLLKFAIESDDTPDIDDNESSYYVAVAKDPSILYDRVKPNKKQREDPDYVPVTWYDRIFNALRSRMHIDKKAHMWMLDSTDTYYYAIMDVWLTWQLKLWQDKELSRWHNVELASTLNEMLLKVIFRMELSGLVLDRDNALKQVAKYKPRITELQDIFNNACVTHDIEPHSIGSSTLLKRTLNKLLPVAYTQAIYPEWWSNEKPTDTYQGKILDSTGKFALEKVDKHPIVKMVIEYRRLSKTVATYLEGWLQAADSNDIVRPNINLTGTYAGRLSSSGEAGNFQNIPRRGGYTVLESFTTPGKDWLWFAIDYGQLEARIAAWYAETLLKERGVHNLPATMTDIFAGDYDIDRLRTIRPDIDPEMFLKPNGSVDMHNFTREVINLRSVAFGDMTDEQILIKRGYDLSQVNDIAHEANHEVCRYMAKTLNFGLLYSGTKYMASGLLKIDLDSAELLVQAWRNLFPAFAVAQDYYTNLAMTKRHVPDGTHIAQYVTQELTGRHRRVNRYPTYKKEFKYGYWRTGNPRENAAKKVWNNQVQGVGGYLTTHALLRFINDHDSEGFRPSIIIHDAIDGYIRRDSLHLIPVLMDYMIDYPIVPGLTVELEYSAGDWQHMTSVKNIDNWIKEWSI